MGSERGRERPPSPWPLIVTRRGRTGWGLPIRLVHWACRRFYVQVLFRMHRISLLVNGWCFQTGHAYAEITDGGLDGCQQGSRVGGPAAPPSPRPRRPEGVAPMIEPAELTAALVALSTLIERDVILLSRLEVALAKLPSPAPRLVLGSSPQELAPGSDFSSAVRPPQRSPAARRLPRHCR